LLPRVSETIAALTAEIEGLLSPPPDPAFAPDVMVSAVRSHPAGVGGFLGMHPDPFAELHARRLDAQVVVRVRAGSIADLFAAEAQTVRDVVGADPALLRSRGLIRLERVLDGPDRTLGPADGFDAPAGRELRFAVAFEHRPVPDAPEGTLDAVPLDVATALLSRTARRRYVSEFLTDPLADFGVPTGAGTIADWPYDAAAQEIRQTSNLGGGDDAPNGNKTGTYLVLRPPVIGGPVADFVLHADLRSDGPGGIGLVFRFVNPANFGFFLMDEPGGWRIFGRRTDGSRALFETGARDLTAGFAQNEWLRLRLLAQGSRFELAINERTVLSAGESGLTEGGTVGFFCRRNATARFRQLRLTSL